MLAVMLIVSISSFYLCRKGEESKMVAYMEHKYGESFSVMESYAGQLGRDYTMFRVRSNDRNQEGILVRAFGTEKISYQDNYLALDLCQYFGHKKLKVHADFFNSSSSFCWGVI